MSEANSAAQSTANNQSSSAESAQATNGQQKFVTAEELEAFRAEVKQGLQGQSNALGGIRNIVEKLQKPSNAEAAKQKPDDLALTDRVKAIEARESAQREATRFAALKTAAMSKGVPERKAELLAKLAIADHGDRIAVDDTWRVSFKESEDKITPVSDWVSAFLQTSDGEAFLPVKATASTDGVKGGGNGAAKTHPFSSLTNEQLMEKSRTQFSEYMNYARNFPEEFAAKTAKK